LGFLSRIRFPLFSRETKMAFNDQSGFNVFPESDPFGDPINTLIPTNTTTLFPTIGGDPYSDFVNQFEGQSGGSFSTITTATGGGTAVSDFFGQLIQATGQFLSARELRKIQSGGGGGGTQVITLPGGVSSDNPFFDFGGLFGSNGSAAQPVPRGLGASLPASNLNRNLLIFGGIALLALVIFLALRRKR
jgi:hypothetical protein